MVFRVTLLFRTAGTDVAFMAPEDMDSPIMKEALS
jgi:hypothetical protein